MNKYTDTQKKYFLKLKIGQKISGKVKRFTNYGAFVNLGMIDGLLATKDIAWGRIKDPEDALKLNQKLEVIIIFKDDVKFNIAVGLKQLLPNPWDVAKTKYKVGDTVVGQVVDIQSYGAFLQIFPGFEGLVHVSEIYSDKKITDAKNFFESEEVYETTIVMLDFENKKMGLSIK